MSLYEIYYVMFNALEKCPSVVLKKHDHFRRMIEMRPNYEVNIHLIDGQLIAK